MSILIFTAIFVFLSTSFSFAETNMVDIETAILKGEYRQAQELAEGFVNKNSNGKEIYEGQYYLGLSLLKQEKYARARAEFQKVVEYSREKILLAKAYLGMVDSYFLSHQYSDALHTAQKALKILSDSPYSSAFYLKLARAQLKLAQWKEARENLDKIIKDFADSPEGYSAHQLLEEKQYFAVQVGSFLERKKAEGLVAELENKGQYAYIVETSGRDKRIFYRVRVGQLAALDEATQLKSKLAALGYPTQIYP